MKDTHRSIKNTQWIDLQEQHHHDQGLLTEPEQTYWHIEWKMLSDRWANDKRTRCGHWVRVNCILSKRWVNYTLARKLWANDKRTIRDRDLIIENSSIAHLANNVWTIRTLEKLWVNAKRACCLALTSADWQPTVELSHITAIDATLVPAGSCTCWRTRPWHTFQLRTLQTSENILLPFIC